MIQYIFNVNGDLEISNAGEIVRTYTFDQEGDLTVQRIAKSDLAYFYGKTPLSFRNEIENLFIMSVKKKMYTSQEVRKIFNHLGAPTRADVSSAIPRIIEYHKKRRAWYMHQQLTKQQHDEQCSQLADISRTVDSRRETGVSH